MSGNLTCETYSLFLSFIEIRDLVLIEDWWFYWVYTHRRGMKSSSRDINKLTCMLYGYFILKKWPL